MSAFVCQARRATLALGAALMLLTGMSTSGAHAATGTFTYISPDSGEVEILDPDDGECRLLLQGALEAVNGTDATAFLFGDQVCEEAHSTMAPGQARQFGEPIPHSVMFVHTRLR